MEGSKKANEWPTVEKVRGMIGQESTGARSESCPRGTGGAVYGVCKGSCESVAGGGDGAFVAPAPLCANSRAFVLYRAMR